MAERWGEMLGNFPERERVLHVLTHALAPSTAQSYGDHIARFVKWCERQPDQPSPLPATTGTVLRWLASDVTRDNRVKAGSLQPYLSALNTLHKDLDYDEPALGHLIQRYRKGLAHLQADDGRDAVRVYLPPDVVERIFDWCLALDLKTATAKAKSAFRAGVATVFTFVFFARGATGSQLRVKDVRRSVAGLTITLDHEKGKRAHGRARTITIPHGSIYGLARLLAKWEAFRGQRAPSDCYYALPDERRTFPSSAIDGWVREILAHLDVRPPPGELWSGHSLRKGAASGGAAEGVSLDRICWMGGWAIRSAAVHDYIDPTCPQTPACRRLFGWLRPR